MSSVNLVIMSLCFFFWTPHYRLMHHPLRIKNWNKCHLSRINLSRCINDALHNLLQIPRPCHYLLLQFLIHNLLRILRFLLSIFLLVIFILMLINLLPFEKANKVVLHIFCIILCLMLIFHHLFIRLSHPFILTVFSSPWQRPY